MAPRCRAAAGATPRRRASSQPSRKPASKASPAPVVSVALIGVVATSKRSGLRSVRTWIDAPLRPRLTTAMGASSSSALARTSVPRSAFASSRVANSRSGAASRISARRAAGGRGRAAARWTRGPRVTSGAGRAAEADRLHARQPERLVEQRVGGEMHGVGALEPRRPEVLGAQQERGAAVLDERALAVRVDEHADPRGPRAGHADRADRDAVGGRRGHQRATRAVATDRAHERRTGTEPAEPSRRRRRRPARAEQDPAPDVAAALDVALRRQDHVDHDVADDDHARPLGRAPHPVMGPRAPRHEQGWHAAEHTRANLRGTIAVRQTPPRRPQLARHRRQR